MPTKTSSTHKSLSQLRAERAVRTIANGGKSKRCKDPISSVYVCHYRKSPFLHGVGSLGNVSGGYSRLCVYIKGSYLRDLRKDWLLVGEALRESLKSFDR